MMRRNCCSATSIPAAVQRLRMSPSRQRLTLRWVYRTISIIDSQQFVEHSVLASCPPIPRRIRVGGSSIPPPRHAAPVAFGVGGGELEPLLGELRIAERPRGANPGADLRALPLGQEIADVSLLVAVAAGDKRVLAQTLLYRLAQPLG